MHLAKVSVDCTAHYLKGGMQLTLSSVFVLLFIFILLPPIKTYHTILSLSHTQTNAQLFLMSARVGFKQETDDKTTRTFYKQNSRKRADGNCGTRFSGTCRLRLPKRSELSPLKYFKHISDKVAAVLRLVSTGAGASPKDISSSGRAKPLVAPIDSHRAEAIDDCIEFINTSSSLQRSNSVSC